MRIGGVADRGPGSRRTPARDGAGAGAVAAGAGAPRAREWESPERDPSEQTPAGGTQGGLAVPDCDPVPTPESPSPGGESRALGARYRGEEHGKGWQEV